MWMSATTPTHKQRVIHHSPCVLSSTTKHVSIACENKLHFDFRHFNTQATKRQQPQMPSPTVARRPMSTYSHEKDWTFNNSHCPFSDSHKCTCSNFKHSRHIVVHPRSSLTLTQFTRKLNFHLQMFKGKQSSILAHVNTLNSLTLTHETRELNF